MKVLPLFLFLSLAAKEPPAINKEEEIDEVFQAEQREIYISCLMNTHDLIESSDKPKQIPDEKAFKKYSAGILNTCLKGINSAQKTGDSRNLIENMKKVLEAEFQDFSLSKEEEELVSKIITEMNKMDDGFDQNPPIVKQALEMKHGTVLYEVGIGSAVVILVVMCIFFNDEKKRREKRNMKRKRD